MSHHFVKFNAAGLLVTGAVLLAVLAHLNVPQLIGLISHVDVHLALAGLAMMVLQIIFLTARWDILINLDRPKIAFSQIARFSFVSTMTNFVFFTSLSGALLRLALTMRAGIPLILAACATLIDRFFSVGILLLIALLFMPFTLLLTSGLDLNVDLPFLFILSSIVVIGGGLYLVTHPVWIEKFIGRRNYNRSKYYFLRLARSRNLGKAVLYSLAAQFSFFTGVYFILQASGIDISFFSMMTILPLIAIVSSLPISVSGWGVREGMFVVGLGLMNIPYESAFIASVQVGVYTMLAAILLGLPVLLTRRTSDDIKNVILQGRSVLERVRGV